MLCGGGDLLVITTLPLALGLIVMAVALVIDQQETVGVVTPAQSGQWDWERPISRGPAPYQQLGLTKKVLVENVEVVSLSFHEHNPLCVH